MQTASLQRKRTRFRAYQLKTEGSSFSYFDGNNFTLIEARLNDINHQWVEKELAACGVKSMSCLHITSWDKDHCTEADLIEILVNFRPNKIQYPGYPPHTDTGKECLKIIENYKKEIPSKTIQSIDPPYINSLENGEHWGYKDILYHPKYLSEKSNDNSTINLFRTGSFNVASLGDVEDPYIAAGLKRCNIFCHEVDILILPHHGADNGFSTGDLFNKVRPSVAICSSNYDNQFEHPKDEIRNLLHEHNIPIYTTKTGDIVITSLEPHNKQYKVFNLMSDSEKISSEEIFQSKKYKILSHNLDTVRNSYSGNKQPFYKRFK